ncbi:hypothetical protein MPER_09306 [Moniliophthora perniciosa FA553]|nr:hypothetical protein MPER_09306 [Moniliophthora perniciosa FA553]
MNRLLNYHRSFVRSTPTRIVLQRPKMSTEAPIAKKQKVQKVIGTHNGTFHCDEALAVFLLRQTSTYRDSGKDLTLEMLLVL